jgi:CRP-like cAMP-binding protein
MKSYTILENCTLNELEAPCFQNLSSEEAELVKDSKTQVIFRKGESLTKQGAFASSVLFLLTGLVKQYVEGDGTKNLNLRILKSGEFVGLSAAFNKSTYYYSAVALTETKACLIEKEAIANLVKNNGNFAYHIIRRYFEQDSNLYQAISALMYKQMNGRLADALLYLSGEDFIGENLFVHLNRKDIADFAGLAVESTVKLLKIFEKDGILKLEDKNIAVLNRPALIDISRRG